jgi:hypothetical protein
MRIGFHSGWASRSLPLGSRFDLKRVVALRSSCGCWTKPVANAQPPPLRRLLRLLPWGDAAICREPAIERSDERILTYCPQVIPGLAIPSMIAGFDLPKLSLLTGQLLPPPPPITLVGLSLIVCPFQPRPVFRPCFCRKRVTTFRFSNMEKRSGYGDGEVV